MSEPFEIEKNAEFAEQVVRFVGKWATDQRFKDRGFEINQPVTLTVRTGNGFIKKAFIGEELLLLRNAYVGKRKLAIIQFEVVHTTQTIEVTVADATRYIDGFSLLWEEFMNTYYSEDAEVALNKQMEEYANDERYGSW